MSRQETTTTLRARVRELEAEVARWKQDYKDLALAIAAREGYPTQQLPAVVPAVPPPSLAALPPGILLAIETTTEPYSEARTAAVEAARGLLEQGVAPDEVETHLRSGDEVKV